MMQSMRLGNLEYIASQTLASSIRLVNRDSPVELNLEDYLINIKIEKSDCKWDPYFIPVASFYCNFYCDSGFGFCVQF